MKLAKIFRSPTWFIFISAIWLCLSPAAEAQGFGQGKNVLLLFPAEMTLPANAVLSRSIRKALKAGSSAPIEIYTEYLDRARFSSELIDRLWGQYLREKYADRPIDLVIANFGTTLNFLLKHRSELFTGIPIVFSAVEQRELGGIPQDQGITGVPARFDLSGTLDMALQLHLDTREVVVVGGAAPFDRFWQAEARREFQPYEGRVVFRYLTEAPMSQLLRELAHLPDKTIVFYLSVLQDSTGNHFVSQEVVEQVSRVGSAPVYSVSSTYLGHGIVGGNLASFKAQGEQAAALALRILKGERLEAIAPPEVVPNTLLFDGRELRRWGIDEGRLPRGSRVRFRAPSLWERYRWQILGIIALCLGEAVLIGALLVQRRIRKRAEIEVERNRQELSHCTRVATMGELTASMAHELNQPLTAILSNAQAAQRLLGTEPPDLEEVRAILTDVVDDNKRAVEVIQRMRTFLRKGPLERSPIHLNELIEEVIKLLYSEVVIKNSSIGFAGDGSLPPVLGDRVQLQQVVLNLLVNGLEAVASLPQSRRRIGVQTARNGKEIHVTVQDQGVGIDQDHLTHLFEPFYTTKADGMGMGLSISRSIIEAHGGRIWAANNAEGGASFYFTLPIQEKALA